MIYYLSLGSNLAPSEHIARALRELSERYGCILVLPIVRTEPCAINSSNAFLNTIAVVSSNESSQALKAWLNSLEAEHGRDRNDPERSHKDRTLDIDILLGQEAFDFTVAETNQQYFSEPYVQASLQALQNETVFDTEQFAHNVNTSDVLLPGASISLGHRAATIDFEHSSGNIFIRENSLDTLLERFEATLDRQQGFA
ncbi:2-amino-4-hydroxy-6-hydroxymethyldihydropteridine pyrophosphokinase [Idiomarina sp. A28L]|nr:2-amino-4-hydroxy-6-hydroxymethyldihydropteridine pyrophosphokinase [Idiomarina sp. A28L]